VGFPKVCQLLFIPQNIQTFWLLGQIFASKEDFCTMNLSDAVGW